MKNQLTTSGLYLDHKQSFATSDIMTSEWEEKILPSQEGLI